ncbi:hypothetical protein [Pseudooceanicola sp.]|uniref:hypothetical protein n=1 Tax=Pseudooceanicola sp. TaxID=1914328 RepID=UPI0035C6CF81
MRILVLPLCLALAACGSGNGPFSRSATPAAAPPAVGGPYAEIRPQGRPGEGGEISVAQPAAPLETGSLGTTIASLGNAAEPGLWLKTPLVRAEGPGTVRYSGTGKSVTARLIPIDGPRTAGSRASLQLMQALGAPLTGLPEFSVSR